jgi:RNA polymerase sigma-70 factor (ECF subfamily)
MTGDVNSASDPPAARSFAPDEVRQLFAEHYDELYRFLLGVTHDEASAADAAQAAYLSALETAHAPRNESQKAWLFQVAYRAALATRRRAARSQEIIEQNFGQVEQSTNLPEAPVIREESIALVRGALARLTADQQAVIRMKIEEGKTFAAISDELGIPIPTALSRMQAALKKLKGLLNERLLP